ncbi:MAG: TetR/AcrR family transcriptional regulator [Proteobacteria bacterium]|nr:TetR/AcrR family transcriptional regulator [Pseudomonadota bacterium]
MGVKERKAREFQRREEDILDAAYQLLTEMEPMQMTMEMMAEHAEIGRGTIYKHFKSKDEIYAHLILRRRKDLLRRMRTVAKEGIERLPRLVRSYLGYCLEDPIAYTVHRRCEHHCSRSNLGEDLIDALKTQQDEKNDLIAAIMRDALGENIGRESSSDYCNYAVWGMLRGAVDGMVENWFDDPIMDPKEYCRIVEHMLLDGILPRSDRDPEIG